MKIASSCRWQNEGHVGFDCDDDDVDRVGTIVARSQLLLPLPLPMQMNIDRDTISLGIKAVRAIT